MRGEISLALTDFDAALHREEGYAEALLRAGFRSPAGVPLRATLRFVQLFGDFGTTDRERTVFLREGGDTSDEDGPARRPTIEGDAAVEEAGSEPEADEPGGEPFAAWFQRIHRSR